METATFRITTIPNSYIKWVEKTRFGFSKSYSYEIFIKNEKIEVGEKCDERAYNRIKATAQIMCLGSFRRVYRSSYNRMTSPKFLKYAMLLKDTFLSKNQGGDERSNLSLIFLPASWNNGIVDPKGNNIRIKAIYLRAEGFSSRNAFLKYEYTKPNQVGVFTEIIPIETYEMSELIQFARWGLLCGMENRRVFGYIEFNSPIEIFERAQQLDYLEIMRDEY